MIRYMQVGIIITGLTLGLISVSCRDIQETTPQFVSSVDVNATQERLKMRAEAAFEAFNSDDHMAYYEYLSPRLRKGRFPFGLELAQRCSPDEFLFQIQNQLFEFMEMINGGGDSILKWSVMDVVVIDNVGYIVPEIWYGSLPVELTVAQKKQRWVFRDGEWWIENEDWRDRCPRLAGTLGEISQ